jgi:hypothetical protein
MQKLACITVGVLMLAAPAWAQDQTPAAPAAQEQVLIVGQRPGPGMWKVSKGDHVLWVFATYAPLPANMQWRAQRVEAIIAQSRHYLAPPSASTEVGFLRGLTLLPQVIGLRKNPGGASLREVVPAEVYARWRVLKARYGVKDDAENERPVFAADTLYRAGLKQSGLSTTDEVAKAVDKLVQKRGLKVMRSHVTLEMKDPARTMKEFKQGSMDDAACFAATLDRLESDLDAMRVRANAWAKGDMEVIRKLSYADREAACNSAMSSSPALKAVLDEQSVEQRMRKLWLEAAEQALAANDSTFAMLKLKDILAGNDLLAALQAKGYLVEAPD